LWAVVRTVPFVACIAIAAPACDSGEDVRPSSTFPAEEVVARTLVGRVLAGTEPVAGALVHVDVSPGLASDAELDAIPIDNPVFPRSVSTNAAGAYRFAFAPIDYDLSIRADSTLVVFRALNVRSFDAPLGIEATPSGFTARIVPSTIPPARAGNAVAYFVSGPDARSLSAGPDPREVKFRRFESTVTLHAVEYVATRGPAGAVAEGRLEVLVRDGALVTPVVPMTLIPTTQKVVFDAKAPPGFTMEPLAVEMDLGLRTSSVPVARVAPGEPLEIGIVAGARYGVRGRAVQDTGAVSTTGWFVFDPFRGTIPLLFADPVSAEAPIDDDAIATGQASNTLGPTTLEAGGVLAARIHKGVIEHVLTPESGTGPVIRIATASRATTLPDATAFGFPRPTGRYVWTLQYFPMLPRIDFLVGEDGRQVPPSWTSAPHVVVLR
jgi:hypothetical protein